MTDAQASRFVDILDNMDAAILAIRDEFQALADGSARRLADLKAHQTHRVEIDCRLGSIKVAWN